ncbi:MAG: FxLYD domain-containing protein [Trueperaceae bacterium]
MKQIMAVLLLIVGLAYAQDVRITHDAGGTDTYGAFVIGEVHNTHDHPVQFVQVIASFYDQDGAFIDSTFSYTDRSTIQAGGRSPFSLGTRDVQEFASYELQVQAREADDPPLDVFSTSDVRLVQDDYGWYLVGQVTNTSDQAMRSVQVIASAYLAGPIVGTGFTYTELDTIQPGGTSPFRLGFQTMLREPTDYRLWVEGRPAD